MLEQTAMGQFVLLIGAFDIYFCFLSVNDRARLTNNNKMLGI